MTMFKRLKNAYEGVRCDSAIFVRGAHMTINVHKAGVECNEGTRSYFSTYNTNFNFKPDADAVIELEKIHTRSGADI